MDLTSFDGLWWVLLLLGPLLLSQRRLHYEIQAVLMMLTRRAELAIALFAMLFLPGVFLHELSHFLMAQVLGVRTGRFSLLPQSMPDGRLRLGYVETENTDAARDALIGAAPLLAGGTFVAFAGLVQLKLPQVWEAWQANDGAILAQALENLVNTPDFWLWFYLTLAVSSTMFPSASDRRAWLPVLLVAVGILGTGLLMGAGPWLVENLGEPINQVFRGVGAVFAVSLAVQLILLLPIFLLRRLLNRLTGLKVI